jgi:hypothetical protein
MTAHRSEEAGGTVDEVGDELGILDDRHMITTLFCNFLYT